MMHQIPNLFCSRQFYSWPPCRRGVLNRRIDCSVIRRITKRPRMISDAKSPMSKTYQFAAHHVTRGVPMKIWNTPPRPALVSCITCCMLDSGGGAKHRGSFLEMV